MKNLQDSLQSYFFHVLIQRYFVMHQFFIFNCILFLIFWSTIELIIIFSFNQFSDQGFCFAVKLLFLIFLNLRVVLNLTLFAQNTALRQLMIKSNKMRGGDRCVSNNRSCFFACRSSYCLHLVTLLYKFNSEANHIWYEAGKLASLLLLYDHVDNLINKHGKSLYKMTE